MQPKILVIGSKDHDRADCVDWLQPFPNIEEYDSIIINLQSLTQVIFDKIYSKISGEMSKEIGTLFDTEREVFCIINQHMVPSPTTTGGKGWVVPPPTNYDWLPATIGVIPVKQGTSINVIDKRFEKYFETIGQWSFILNLYEEPLLKEALQQTYAQYALLLGRAVKILSFQLLPIAENKSKKIIAGTLVHKGRKGIGGIHLLPSPTKSDIKSAVEILLDLIYGQPTKTYLPWREEIEVPAIQDIMKQINLKFQDMKKIQESIEPLQSVIEELDTYRDLFSATGEDSTKSLIRDRNSNQEIRGRFSRRLDK